MLTYTCREGVADAEGEMAPVDDCLGILGCCSHISDPLEVQEFEDVHGDLGDVKETAIALRSHAIALRSHAIALVCSGNNIHHSFRHLWKGGGGDNSMSLNTIVYVEIHYRVISATNGYTYYGLK